MKYPELEGIHKDHQVQILLVMGKVFHFTSVLVIYHSENCFTGLLGFLFSLPWVDGACSDLWDEGGSFLDKFSPRKHYGFMQKLLGWYLLVGDTGEPDRGDSSCVSVCICCGLWGWRERPWFGPLWNLLAMIDSLVRIVLWGLETLFFFFYLKCSFGTLFWFCIFSQIFLCKYVYLSINKCYCKSDFSFHCLLIKKSYIWSVLMTSWTNLRYSFLKAGAIRLWVIADGIQRIGPVGHSWVWIGCSWGEGVHMAAAVRSQTDQKNSIED